MKGYNMNIAVFDTETTSLQKPYCYNIGIVGYNTDTDEILFKQEYVIEQIWYNLELFNTAYYAEKRELYVKSLRSRQSKLDKFGYVMQAIKRLFKAFDIQSVYAYNSPFDERVLSFNCDWFKVINPFEHLPLFDIRGYVFNKIAFTESYKDWCEIHQQFTESANYSTTAEAIYRFIVQDIEFIEDHTALSDSLIELDILKYCIEKGAKWDTEYKVYQSVPDRYKKL